MKLLLHTETLSALCKATGKWGAYFNIYFPEPYSWNELKKAGLWFDIEKYSQALADESGFILFDSEEEMKLIYDQTVGDDGPTKLNNYDGPVRIYMLTCDPTGQLMNENT